MKLTITSKAQAWFKQELELAEGQGIKFYGKVYGKTQVHDGFSVGMA
ncbi:MAG: iron-sulfur cluster biosynthesis protein, partial [Enterococcus sp.]|nr:iron-sulfur cluster biosynthesis protein [Enterococcus sp.]